MSAARYAIIDCETTGFGRSDRMIELAVVLLDGRNLETVDEFDTLLNPMRDVGRTDIHGIRPCMLTAAPTFDEVAGGLARRLDGAILVAHNLPFDARFLRQECKHADVRFEPGVGVCTLALTGERLAAAAARYGIELDGHHRALIDARATASLLRAVMDDPTEALPAHMAAIHHAPVARSLRREATGETNPRPMARLLARACYPSSLDGCVAYFEMLDWVLADGLVSAEERELLDAQIASLGLTSAQVRAMHEAYLASIVRAVQRDGIVTAGEHALLESIARSLGLSGSAVPAVTAAPTPRAAACAELKPGTRICFTGSAVGRDGQPIERESLESLAARLGYQPVASVTKKSCDLLVAADPSSMSGKAQKAHQYGVPIIALEEFLRIVAPSL
jgi:DNA polymerase-3 subunit epsilon